MHLTLSWQNYLITLDFYLWGPSHICLYPGRKSNLPNLPTVSSCICKLRWTFLEVFLRKVKCLPFLCVMINAHAQCTSIYMHMLNLSLATFLSCNQKALATFFIVQSKVRGGMGFQIRAVKLCPSGALPLHQSRAIVLGNKKNIAITPFHFVFLFNFFGFHH